MILSMQSKLKSINSAIEIQDKFPNVPKIVRTTATNWNSKKYADQLDMLANFFTNKYPSHPHDLIATSSKELLDKLITNPENIESIVILNEGGDRIIDLQNITWKKRRTLHFQFCKQKSKNTCSNDQINNVRNKIRELYSRTELHLIDPYPMNTIINKIN